MKNHKLEYPYNYDELKREIKYTITNLKLIVDELEGDPQRFIQRTIKDLTKKLEETEANLKQHDCIKG